MFVSKRKYNLALEQIQELEILLRNKTEELDYHERISANITDLEFQKLNLETENSSLNSKKKTLVEKVTTLENQTEKLTGILKEVEAKIKIKNHELSSLKGEVAEAEQLKIQIPTYKNKIDKLKAEINDKEIIYKKYTEQNKELEIEKLGFSELNSKFDTPLSYLQHSLDSTKNHLGNIEKHINLFKEDKFVTQTFNATTENMVYCIKNLILMAYRNDVEIALLSVKRGNIENITKKMHNIFKNVNDIAYGTGLQLSKEYHEVMFKNLDLVYQGVLIKNEEKERLRALREEELERKRIEKEIKEKLRELLIREKELIKEKALIEREIKVQGQQQELILKLNELQDALGLVDKKRFEIERRESISTSGYVYIISNIGSFGEGIYKIGMTRRLDPSERIRELNSASVPFEFDIHAMILTDDAPKLENALHKILHKQRVNLVNNRKEFFYVDLDKIKHAVAELIETDIIFTEKPKAVQYFETLYIQKHMLEHHNS